MITHIHIHVYSIIMYACRKRERERVVFLCGVVYLTDTMSYCSHIQANQVPGFFSTRRGYIEVGLANVEESFARSSTTKPLQDTFRTLLKSLPIGWEEV